MTETLVSQSQIEAAKSQSFAMQQTDLGYEVARGITKRIRNGHKVESYRDLLPLIDGQTVEGLINCKIQEFGEITLLDVGCGNGRFLIECKLTWQDKINCVGLTAYPYFRYRLERKKGEVEPKTEEDLNKFGITIIEDADAQSLPQYFPSENFDIVACANTARYLADPLALIVGIHKILKVGGTAFINEMRMPTENLDDAKEIIKFFEKFDVSFTPKKPPYIGVLFDVTIVKKDNPLLTPASCVGLAEDMDGPKLVYKFKKPKAA